jgi:hypothetical protein
MSIVQISQIKHRRGTNENLPQLASAELGWSVDTQQLYIGNGTLEEGAPEVGNTEILTVLSAERGDIPGVAVTNSQTLPDNSTGTITNAAYPLTIPGVVVNYVINRNNSIRTGYMRLSHFTSNIAYDEEYTETTDIGVSLSVSQVANTYAVVSYTTSSTGFPAEIKFTAANISF